MVTKHQKLFYTLERILNRSNLSETNQPSTLLEWQDFIIHINNSFYDFDQERYLLEQSMEISSQEMLELNEQLENAQTIARLGYWAYHPTEKKVQFSKVSYELFGLDPTFPCPSYKDIIKLIHIDDVTNLLKLFEQALINGETFDKEFRIHNNTDNEIHWLYIKGHPYKEKNNLQPRYCLSGIIMDITKRKYAEQSEALRHDITKILTEKFSFNDTAPELIKIICKTLKLDLGELWNVDKIANVLRFTTTWTDDFEKLKDFIDYSKKITFSPDQGLPGRVWAQKKICYIKDVVVDKNFPRAAVAKNVDLHSAFAFPIIFEDEVLGVLEFFTHNIISLDDDTLNLLNDINRQIGIFIAREQAYIQMTILSRQAGMSEIATSVLHNVGNILNSVNVSAALIQELANANPANNLVKVCKLINTHLLKQPDYFVNDSKGKVIPGYLKDLADFFVENYAEISKEIDNLIIHIEHIKDIVIMQKDISGVYGIIQTVSLPEVVDLAIQMSCISAYGIQIIKNYEHVSFMTVDKTKLLQILINLIRNADDSLKSSQGNHQNTITISIKKLNTTIEIAVSDNGGGIAKDSLKNIFTMGYTTKVEGHGFGLHNSALAANELGGSLIVDSEGLGKGATFTLSLPENAKEKKQPPTALEKGTIIDAKFK